MSTKMNVFVCQAHRCGHELHRTETDLTCDWCGSPMKIQNSYKPSGVNLRQLAQAFATDRQPDSYLH